MEYKENEIKQGIEFHTINTDKFKTNLMAIFLTTKLTRENVTKNALISLLLKRGSKNMKDQEKISKKMEELYGAIFDCGLDKTGDNQVIKLYIETINDKYLPQSEGDLLKTTMENLLEITFAPYIENGEFLPEYVEQEKNTIRQLIGTKKDNKARYAQTRCIEEMYKNQPYSLFKYGYEEDLEKINGKNLYEYYKELLQTCKIDIFLSGILNGKEYEIIKNNENIQKLEEREPVYIKPKVAQVNLSEAEKIVTENLDVAQGKLVLGLDIDIKNADQKYDVLMYNSILGGTATSKLFQNVREKAHLAYVASSNYFRFKNNIIINCGIEISNFEKALKIVKEQIEDMKTGKFTEEDLENCKKVVKSTIEAIKDEQDTGITYYFSQELSEEKTTPEEYLNRIEKITKENVIDIANKVSINTIYFLKK